MKGNNQPLSEAEKMLAAGYVLGDLAPEEITQLEQLAAQNPALLQEIHAQQASFELLPQALAKVEPPLHLQAKMVLSQPSPVATRQPFRSLSKWIVGAVALIALALTADNFRLRYQLQALQQAQPQRVAAILQQPKSRLIALTGTGSEAAGTLLFTPGRWQEVIVSLGNLPPLPPEQIYRMWLALENGDVIHCGAFNTDDQGSVFVRFTPAETPPQGVKATELFVTVDANTEAPDASGMRVMDGAI